MTCVASSGDSGSNPRQDGALGYLASAPLDVEYPASDPNVTGVGGSQILFDASWAATSEVVFHDTNPVGGAVLATGGGYSRIFPRPSWQANGASTLLAAAAYRCVPDIAAPAAWSTSYQGFYVVYAGGVIGGTGTSLSAPIWAGLSALINQAMTTGGRGSIGLLSPPALSARRHLELQRYHLGQ